MRMRSTLLCWFSIPVGSTAFLPSSSFSKGLHSSSPCQRHYPQQQPHLKGELPSSSSLTSLFIWKELRDLFNPSSSSSAGGGEEDKRHRYRKAFIDEEQGERKRYELGVGSSALPSMDDLWREAWPTDACKDIMEKRENMDTGSGPPQADALIRAFGQNETFYNVFYKDSSSWCPYSQSVWMMLEEKQLPYKIKRINLLAYGEKADYFYDISGTGLLPVLEVDGRIIRESVDICKFINYWQGSQNPRKLFPEKENPLREEADGLLDLERELYKEWFIYVFEGPEARGKPEFLAVLKQVEEALGKYSDTPWFLPGEDIGLVDCVFAPHVERVVASCLYWKGLVIRGSPAYPNLSRWLDALDQRPSYAAFKSDFFTLINSLEPLFGRAYAVNSPEVKAIQAKVDGTDPLAWRLPVKWTVEEGNLEYLPPQVIPSETYARQAAAVKLIINHKRVPRYMLRALGRPGVEYRSPLADPYNELDEWAAPEVDAAYRYLLLALLRGYEAVEPLVREDKAKADAKYTGKDVEKARARTVACLEYLRDRIGVPRDMSLPEARQLRGYLNWLIDVLK